MAYLKSHTAYVYDNLNAPIGTKMAFNQTSAPLGWSKETGSDDVSLRLISGTVGTGGTVAFETAFASKTPTITMTNAAVTLTNAQRASHNHGWSYHDRSPGSTGYPIGFTGNTLLSASGVYGTNSSTGSIGATGSGTSHTHSNSAASSAVNLDVSYVDVIIATKD